MNKTEDLGKPATIYKITCNTTGHNVITYAYNGEISKVIYNKKHSKKDGVFKALLLNDNYTIQHLKTFTPRDKNDINTEILFWKNHTDDVLNELNNKKIEQEKQRLHNEQYQVNCKAGKIGEQKIKPILEQCFNDVLTPTKYRYNKVDFIGKRLLYEIKTFSGNYNEQYATVLLGTNKLICENLLFIFQFGNGDIYFLKGDYKLFNTFNTSFVKHKNRLYENEVYFIPNENLTKLNINETYNVEILDNEHEHQVRRQVIASDKN
jgi:hypothetical protein